MPKEVIWSCWPDYYCVGLMTVIWKSDKNDFLTFLLIYQNGFIDEYWTYHLFGILSHKNSQKLVWKKKF